MLHALPLSQAALHCGVFPLALHAAWHEEHGQYHPILHTWSWFSVSVACFSVSVTCFSVRVIHGSV